MSDAGPSYSMSVATGKKPSSIDDHKKQEKNEQLDTKSISVSK